MFKSQKHNEFHKELCIDQGVCPVRKTGHWGNGKVEKMIRTINERPRIDKDIVVTKDRSGLSKLDYFYLRSGRKGTEEKFGF